MSVTHSLAGGLASMALDPAFWAIAGGFGMIGVGVSPLMRSPENRQADHGCLLVLGGIIVVIAVTATRVLS